MTIGKELERIFDKLKSQIKVAIPCEVVKYDHTKQVVEVKTENGKIIPNIPIFQMTNNGVSGLFVPVSKGCYGALLSFDEDLSAYLNNAKSSYTTRKHDISDSYFIAGFTPKGSRATATDGNTRIFNGDMEIELHPDGKIKIKGASKEVLAVIADFMGNVISNMESIINDAHVVPVGGGSGTHSAALTGGWVVPITGGKAVLQSIKSDLEDLTI
jgi:hypothetical protein